MHCGPTWTGLYLTPTSALERTIIYDYYLFAKARLNEIGGMWSVSNYQQRVLQEDCYRCFVYATRLIAQTRLMMAILSRSYHSSIAYVNRSKLTLEFYRRIVDS